MLRLWVRDLLVEQTKIERLTFVLVQALPLRQTVIPKLSVQGLLVKLIKIELLISVQQPKQLFPLSATAKPSEQDLLVKQTKTEQPIFAKRPNLDISGTITLVSNLETRVKGNNICIFNGIILIQQKILHGDRPTKANTAARKYRSPKGLSNSLGTATRQNFQH